MKVTFLSFLLVVSFAFGRSYDYTTFSVNTFEECEKIAKKFKQAIESIPYRTEAVIGSCGEDKLNGPFTPVVHVHSSAPYLVPDRHRLELDRATLVYETKSECESILVVLEQKIVNIYPTAIPIINQCREDSKKEMKIFSLILDFFVSTAIPEGIMNKILVDKTGSYNLEDCNRVLIADIEFFNNKPGYILLSGTCREEPYSKGRFFIPTLIYLYNK